MTINSNQVDGIGKPGTSRDNISAKNLIKTTSSLFLKNES